MDFLLHWHLLLAVNTGLNLVAGNNTFAGAVSYLVPDWNKLPSSLRNLVSFGVWRTFNFLTPTRMYALAPNTGFIYHSDITFRESRGQFFDSFYFSCPSLATAALRQWQPVDNGPHFCLVPRCLARGAEDSTPILHPHFVPLGTPFRFS